MKIAETVTFGGSGLDRAAELRGNVDALAQAATGGEETLLFWRGKVLSQGDETLCPVRLSMTHPVLAAAGGPPVFLGRDDGRLVYAHDISGWTPEGSDAGQLGSFLDQTEQRHPALPDGQRFVEMRRLLTHLTVRDAELAATAKAVLGWHQTHKFCACCGVRSDMAMSGWQRNCPSCKASHFPRTDPVVIMLITRGNKTLLGRSPGWPEGMYSCLAGFVEPGEPIEAAVRREVFEEAGIRVGRVDYLSSQPWPFPMSLMFGCRGEALNDDIQIDPTEIEDARWVTREELAEAFAGQHPELLPARKGAIAHFLLRNWLADRLD